jgi:hypothetical protein
VVGVTLQRGIKNLPVIANDASVALDEAPHGRLKLGAQRKAPGISVAGALAHLTPHRF